MSEQKHTPGPWTTDNVVTDDGADIILAYDIAGAGNPVLLASVFGDDDGDRPGDITAQAAAANARLMAAAPEMLTALQYIVAWKPAGWSAEEARNMAMAAIAKATTY